MQEIQTKAEASIFFDDRRKKNSGTYPVKLRIYSRSHQIKKLYATKFAFTSQEFSSIWTEKPRKEYKEKKRELLALLAHAESIINRCHPFSFDEFKKRFTGKIGKESSLSFYYSDMIDKFNEAGEHGTAANFECSLKSFKKFVTPTKGPNKGRVPDQLLFTQIDKSWLERYEQFMLNNGKSLTTVSMYTRTLRQAFNLAIFNKDILPELYPFGKNGYQPPAVQKVKKALPIGDLRILRDSDPKTMEQKRAKAYWFLSYHLNGLNLKDILTLKYKNIDGDRLILYRAKTKKAKRTNLTPITVYLNDYSRQMIDEYGGKKRDPENFIFPVLSPEFSSLQAHKAIKNFISGINQGLEKLAKQNGLNANVRTYWARHTFATKAIRDGASTEFVGEALGHADSRTTKNYFDGFEDEVKKAFAQKLMEM